MEDGHGTRESDACVGRVGDHGPMQLSPITTPPIPITPVQALGSAAPAAHALAAPSFAAARLAAASPAPVVAPASLESAVDAVARLAAPLIDFPGIAAGQVFDIVKGSKVGFLGVKGEATITRFTDDGASFAVKAGAFGVKVDVVVDVQRTGADTVRISSRGSGIPDQQADGRIVESRTNYAEFARIDDPSQRTVISHDGRGGIVIDTVVPTFGNAHLVLARLA